MITGIQKWLAILLVGVASRLFIVPGVSKAVESAPADGTASAVLQGQTRDKENREAVGFVNILVQEANRSITCNEQGEFCLSGLVAGEFTIKTFRIGYRSVVKRITLQATDTTGVVLLLERALLTSPDIVVEAERSGAATTGIKPALLISDRKLYQNLGKTIAETIDYEPGISQRTMGPAPARPVLRGLEGDRLPVLEDGNAIGDLSATSADHAVVIEPVTAERIEIIRGPQSLVYGSNTLGGVVNIVRHAIPSARVTHSTGSLTIQNETVNRGLVTAGDMTLSTGFLTTRLDASVRRAYDISTPDGVLPNTGINTKNYSAGIGLARDRGNAGIAAGVFESSYGIPPDPDGGHPRGVDINMRRQHQEAMLELLLGGKAAMRLEIRQSYTRYYHEELEANGSLGMNFGVVTQTGAARLYLQNRGLLKSGIIGINGQYRDYASGGLSFTPAAAEYLYAMYYYQEAVWRKVQLCAAVRYDWKTITPAEKRYSRNTGYIRQRRFDGYAAAFGIHYQLARYLALGASAIHTFRAPGVEELFSEGPHLAAYSYDIGNADLGVENGMGTEITVEYQQDRNKMRLTLFRNRIDNYLWPINTGEKSWRRADLYVYKYSGEAALMRGVEATADIEIYRHLFMTGSLGTVHGQFTRQRKPIPRMPPLEGKLGVYYSDNRFTLGAVMHAADRQNRPGEFEKETAGYVILSLYLQYYFSNGPFLHTVTVTGGNITNAEYHKHLNRVKEVMPEPGRNIRILYKVFL